MQTRSGAAFACAFAFALLLPAFAGATEPKPEAESKVRCRSAYERGQQLKLEGRPTQARVALRVCSESCPPPFATDCARWTSEVDALLPTVRLRARGEHGERLTDVRALVDGQLLADPIPEESIAVDPGDRVLRFERPGFAPVTVAIRLEPGERDHEVSVAIRDALRADAGPSAPPSTAPLAGPTRPADPAGSSRLPSYVLGGLGLSALLVGGGLAVKGHVDRTDLADTCAPACDPARTDPIRSLWVASGIIAGAGLASVVLAFVLWPRGDRDTSPRVVASVSPLPSGGVVSAVLRLP